MYYEIYFAPEMGEWRIRISYVRFLIFTCYAIVRAEGDREGKWMGFPTYTEAVEHVNRIGLPNVYRLRTYSKTQQAINALVVGAA